MATVEPYEIKFAGVVPNDPGRDATQAVRFDVALEGAPVLRLAASMSGTLAASFADKERGELLGLIAEAALEDLELGLRAGIYPPENGKGRLELIFSTEDHDRVKTVDERERDKRCLWQDRQPRGWNCTATPDGGNPATSPTLCAGCVIPDERVVCAHLSHVRVNLIESMASRTRVTALRPMCNAGNDPGPGGDECRLGGLECWRRIVDPEAEVVEVPIDIARRAADEIDYFALVFRDRYGVKGWRIPQARSISEFFGECSSAEDFERRVAALADLLGKLSPHEALPESERFDENGRSVGSLVALELLMKRDAPEAVAPVKRLRQITRARNSFPIHSRTDQVLSDLRNIGVEYPARSWELAWRQVLTTFWSSIAAVRTALQMPPAEE